MVLSLFIFPQDPSRSILLPGLASLPLGGITLGIPQEVTNSELRSTSGTSGEGVLFLFLDK